MRTSAAEILRTKKGKQRTMPYDRCKEPIIGILAQETSIQMKEELKTLGLSYDSYIAASYVKAVESSGSRVMPIFLNEPEEYYRKCLKSINGLLLPGGNTWFYKEDDVTPRDDGYTKAAEILYNQVKEINKEMSQSGMSFPILGICLGFEVLLFIDTGKKEYRDTVKTIKSPLPLHFKSDIGPDLEAWPLELFKEPVSYFSHQFYIKEETIESEPLNKEWKIIATTFKEIENIKYVSIIKSKKYPILGLQFHPEKNAYEWKKKFNIPHNENSIKAARCFFDWLVNHSKNSSEIGNGENIDLINKFTSTFTPQRFSFDEIYFFPQNNTIQKIVY